MLSCAMVGEKVFVLIDGFRCKDFILQNYDRETLSGLSYNEVGWCNICMLRRVVKFWQESLCICSLV